MPAKPMISLREHFAVVQEPRRDHGRRHHLWDLVALAICAVVCGADSWVEVEEYGLAKQAWLETFLELPGGIPSHDTIGRVFSLIDPQQLQDAFFAWVQSLVDGSEGRLINIDGKTACASAPPDGSKKALHLISAWAHANHVVLGQVAVDDKSNEITAIPELLRLLDLHGALVTIDAMGCQKKIAAAIVNGGGDYVLALKQNQETLYQEVQELFLDGLAEDFVGLKHSYQHSQEKGHGRIEERAYHLVEAPAALLANHPDWEGLHSVGMVFSTRQLGTGEPKCETRFFVCSRRVKVKRFAEAVRGHWGIENSLHWVLDVAFREDACRVHQGHAAENLCCLRRLTASLLKNAPERKGGIACKRKQAGWDNDCLLQILRASLV